MAVLLSLSASGLSFSSAFFLFFAALLLSACSPEHQEEVDNLNENSYYFHYKNIDSTAHYARQALALASGYDAGRAEAMNHLAFVSIARMQYDEASQILDSIAHITDNQVELLVAYVQQMRLCQRESRNKDFYEYHELALRAVKRLSEDGEVLSAHQRARQTYAESELAIVNSTYYYYIGLDQQAIDALNAISADDIESDTAQYLNYLYQIGAGGIIKDGTPEQISQREWDYLMRCYQRSVASRDVYWEANSLQALSEHLFVKQVRDRLIADNRPAITMLNTDNMPDSLLAGNLAQRSLELFNAYGDVYQIAGAYRTLASCYWALGDFNASIYCLEEALNKNKAIEQAPDLVASIRERLSLTYSAIDNKPKSDYNRNIYLDLQEMTRQDRQLEARAEQLARSSRQLNWMMGAVVLMIVVVVLSFFIFAYLRRRDDRRNSLQSLLQPLREWQQSNALKMNELEERMEEVGEACQLSMLHVEKSRKTNIENRAKVFLVNSIMPFIDRIIHEVRKLKDTQESTAVREERYEYLAELTDKINEYNSVLTQWIQLQQGQLRLHIESFHIQELFDIVAKGRMSFQLKGITLHIEPTDAVVKADKTLTLFMINTIADNARKFTPDGGTVGISAAVGTDYVEISVEDTGRGISEEQLQNIFDHKVNNGHGFGLMNCKGIIDKYHKVSQIFKVCSIGAESRVGQGSRFFFRLPKGVLRLLAVLFTLLQGSISPLWADVLVDPNMGMAERCADSAYYSNIDGRYEQAIAYTDSALEAINRYVSERYPDNRLFLSKYGSGQSEPEEIGWYHSGLDVNYQMLLDIRNECAVAALALHDWPLYYYNNHVYTQLYKETTADNMLGSYVREMQHSEVNKTIAIALLVLLLVVIIVAYYMLYYRHLLYFRFCVEQVEHINEMLLSHLPNEEKLARLDRQIADKNMQWPERLRQIVEQIHDALQQSVKQNNTRQLNIELAEDELRRSQYEEQKLYVCNNVLDNCLSTLKHETMYYPSRIRQLVDAHENNIQAIDEVASYYKELYALLSAQAMRQLENVKSECRPVSVYGAQVLGDEVSVGYLFELLRKECGEKTLPVTATSGEGRYVVFRVEMPQVAPRAFFTPSMQNIPYLICRQIVRDLGEATNQRGCGIVADAGEKGGTAFSITLAGRLEPTA